MAGSAKPNWQVIVVVVACWLCAAAGPAQADRWLVEEMPPARTDTSGGNEGAGGLPFGDQGDSDASGGSTGRNSLNVDLVVSIIQDRAKQAALRLVADTLSELSLGEQPLYVDELIERSVHILGSDSGVRKDLLVDVAYILVRAVAARAVLATTLKLQSTVGKQGELVRVWRERLQAASSSPLRDKLLAIDIAAAKPDELARQIVEWTYWLLGTDALFDASSTALPSCPGGPNPGKGGPLGDLCRVLVAAEHEDRIALLSSAVRWNDVVKGIELVDKMRKKGSVDVETLIELLVQFGDRIAQFGVTPGLDVAMWKQRVATLAGQKRAVPEVLDVLQSGCRGSGATVDITAALRTGARKAQAELQKAAVVLRTPATVEWLAAAANGAVGTAIAAPTLATCEIRDLIHKTDFSKLEQAVFYVESFVANYGGDVAKLSASRIPQLAKLLEGLVTELANAETFVGKLPVPEDLSAEFAAVRDDLGRARRVVERLGALFAMVQSAADVGTDPRALADVLSPLALLGTLDPERARVVSPILELLGSLPATVQRDGAIEPSAALAILSEIRVETVLAALGISTDRDDLCRDSEKATCWLFRLVQGFQESLSVAEDKLTIDSGKLLDRFATVGDSFQRSSRWRSYFHLTLGMGVLRAFNVPVSSGTEDRWAPVVAEQIGFGLASPAFLGDRITFKVGVFGSGLLYRVVLDSNESDAVMLGGFAAIDLHDSIELFIAPQVILYAAGADTDAAAEFGVSAGLQVPLADYLQRL